ncbi:MAG: L,D-transpeptidase family protein [Xanthobacteraceae bacterium]|uniref:L,D-transpeptidase family protein n=1 Tax=Pseudolabrys sp. TaxID=1960880 RepID=UPI003D0C3B69
MAVTLSGCNYADNIAPTGRAQAPLSDKTLALLEEKQMDKDSPILVRLFKEESEAEVWKKNRSGEYALLKTYPICRWSGDLGPKVKEGDRQAPEGFYTVTPGQMNPNSNYYLAFNMGYPNAFDRSWGRTGSELMVHGDCSSRGCYAMTDEQMVEIYALARESFFGGQKAFQVQAYPFRMTARNLARHRNSPHLAFWKMLKVGSDHFEVTRQQPKVDVCERHYVFDATTPEGAARAPSFSARGKCPAFQVEPTIASAVAEKQQRDNTEYAELVSSNISVVASRKGVDGGMHPSFYDKLQATSVAQGDTRFSQPVLIASTTPGALPRTSSNPPAQTTIPANMPGVEPKYQLASVETGTPAIRGKVPVPDAAPLPKTGEAPEQPKTIGGLLDNLLSGSSAEASATPTEAAEPAPAPATRTAAAKRRPAKPTRVAAKPSHKPAAESNKPVEHRTAAAAPPEPEPKPELKPRVAANDERPAPAAQPQTRTAFTSTPQRASMMGAQPVVPAGSFESRWSGLRN